jgi:hypothetical protein
MESIYHIVTIRVNETYWAHIWRLRFLYFGMGYDNISRHRRTGMHFVTRRSHMMQKHKFGVTSLVALFMLTAPVPPKHEKLCADVS